MNSSSHAEQLRCLHTSDVMRLRSSLQLVDAHGAPYFASGHVPDAVNLPPHEVKRLAPRRLRDRGASIVVYGARGSSNARIVAEQLVELGYSDVSLYVDGLEGWIAAGQPVTSAPDEASG